ncbi:MAG: hypothetical protein WC610_02150 [Patescibacteria group bacterium]
MIKQCCVCKRFYVDGKWVKKQISNNKEVTHGYCDRCFKKVMKEIHQKKIHQAAPALPTSAKN